MPPSGLRRTPDQLETMLASQIEGAALATAVNTVLQNDEFLRLHSDAQQIEEELTNEERKDGWGENLGALTGRSLALRTTASQELDRIERENEAILGRYEDAVNALDACFRRLITRSEEVIVDSLVQTAGISVKPVLFSAQSFFSSASVKLRMEVLYRELYSRSASPSHGAVTASTSALPAVTDFENSLEGYFRTYYLDARQEVLAQARLEATPPPPPRPPVPPVPSAPPVAVPRPTPSAAPVPFSVPLAPAAVNYERITRELMDGLRDGGYLTQDQQVDTAALATALVNAGAQVPHVEELARQIVQSMQGQNLLDGAHGSVPQQSRLRKWLGRFGLILSLGGAAVFGDLMDVSSKLSAVFEENDGAEDMGEAAAPTPEATPAPEAAPAPSAPTPAAPQKAAPAEAALAPAAPSAAPHWDKTWRKCDGAVSLPMALPNGAVKCGADQVFPAEGVTGAYAAKCDGTAMSMDRVFGAVTTRPDASSVAALCTEQGTGVYVLSLLK